MKQTLGSLLVFTFLSAFALTASATDVLIYDAQLNPLVPLTGKGALVLRNGKRTGRGLLHVSSDASSANVTIGKILDFFSSSFNRDSYDNRGSQIEATVNLGSLKFLDFLGLGQNAAWAGGEFKFFIFGKGGKDLNDFTRALDVVAHEYTHAVIDSSSKLEYVGESGALNESLADLMGETVQMTIEGAQPGREYMIGESVLTPELVSRLEAKGRKVTALRDLRNPQAGLVAQPGHVNEIPAIFQNCVPTKYNDNCGVHVLSGITNKAGATIMSKIGLDKSKKLFYIVMTERLTPKSQFNDFARELRRECSLSLESDDCTVVDAALRDVGL